MTFNDFCYNQLDGLYNPRFNYEDQCSGYKMFRQMLLDDITPATKDEMEDFENNVSIGMEYHKQYVKCLGFLHPVLRPFIVDNWDNIKLLFNRDENIKKLIDKI